MLRIRNLILLPEEDRPEKLKKLAAGVLGIAPSEIAELRIVRRSIDARKKDRVKLLYTVDISAENELALKENVKADVSAAPEDGFRLPEPSCEPQETAPERSSAQLSVIRTLENPRF